MMGCTDVGHSLFFLKPILFSAVYRVHYAKECAWYTRVVVLLGVIMAHPSFVFTLLDLTPDHDLLTPSTERGQHNGQQVKCSTTSVTEVFSVEAVVLNYGAAFFTSVLMCRKQAGLWRISFDPKVGSRCTPLRSELHNFKVGLMSSTQVAVSSLQYWTKFKLWL